ncbi:hypothetical protein AGMMS50225_04470 [Betaproteobacteria bacterium]|nr:hypothetical protein AGMMS50225_04470 [Betaproteobacteria bacterium]
MTMIQRQNQIKIFEIIDFQLACAQPGEIVTALCGSLDHARIWRLARMPAIGAGRINLNPPRQPAMFDVMTCDPLGCGRTTDIPRTHEKNPKYAIYILAQHWLPPLIPLN